MSGWQMLGNALGGGVETAKNDAYLEGQHIGAKTQNALAQARTRRIDEAQKMQEYEARKNMQESLVQAFGLDTTQAAGIAGLGQAGMGNIQQLMQSRNTNQEFGFRNEMADPETGIGRGQQLRMAAGDAPFETVGSGQGMLWDRFSDDPMGSALTTPGTEASIRQRDAAALLSDERRLNPERFRNVTQIGFGMDGLFDGSMNFPSSLPEDADFGAGAGAPAMVQRAGNVVADLFGADLPFPEAETAIQALDNLNVRTRGLAQSAIPGRPSNYLLQLLGNYVVEPAALFYGRGRARERFRQTRDTFANEAGILQQRLQNPAGLSKADISKTRIAWENMMSLVADYDRVLGSFDNAGTQGAVQRPEVDLSEDDLINKWSQ